jgi:hypothetical protein
MSRSHNPPAWRWLLLCAGMVCASLSCASAQGSYSYPHNSGITPGLAEVQLHGAILDNNRSEYRNRKSGSEGKSTGGIILQYHGTYANRNVGGAGAAGMDVGDSFRHRRSFTGTRPQPSARISGNFTYPTGRRLRYNNSQYQRYHFSRGAAGIRKAR